MIGLLMKETSKSLAIQLDFARLFHKTRFFLQYLFVFLSVYSIIIDVISYRLWVCFVWHSFFSIHFHFNWKSISTICKKPLVHSKWLEPCILDLTQPRGNFRRLNLHMLRLFGRLLDWMATFDLQINQTNKKSFRFIF